MFYPQILLKSQKYKCRNIEFDNRYGIEKICRVKKDNSEVMKILASDINDEISDYGDTALKTVGATGKSIVKHVPSAIVESILSGVYESLWDSL